MNGNGFVEGTKMPERMPEDCRYLCVIIIDWVINSNGIKIYSWDQLSEGILRFIVY